MPIPATIDDLDPVAANNSPLGSEPPTEGDNHIRALASIIRQVYDGIGADAGIGGAPFDPSDTFDEDTLGFWVSNALTDFNVFKWIPTTEWAAILDGTSTYDSSAAWISAITAALAAGRPAKVTCPTGRYRCDSALGEFTGGDDVTIDFNGATLDFVGVSLVTNGPLLAFTGTYGATAALTSNAAERDTSLSVTSTGFSAGDMVRVYSSEKWDDTRTDTLCGEISFLEAVPSGSAVTLVDGLKDAYATANSATLQKLTPIRNLHIRNGVFLGPSGDDQLIGIRIRLGLECSIEHMNTRDIDLVHIRMTDCVLSWIDRNTVFEANENSQAYGISLQDACQDCSVTNNKGRNIRHFFTTNNNVSTSYGIIRGALIQGNQCFNSVPNLGGSSGDAFDTHAGADDIHFIGNTVRGAYGAGVNFEAKSGSIKLNRIYGTTASGIFYNPYHDAGSGQMDIIGNIVEGVGDDTATNDYGIVCTVQVAEIGRLKINDNTVRAKSALIRVVGTVTYPIGRLTCNGNTADYRTETLTSQGTVGLDIRFVARGTINGNSVLARLNAADIRDSSHIAVVGNQLEINDDGTSGSPGAAVRSQDSSYLNVSDNNCYYSNTGIASTTAIAFNAASPVTNSDVRCNKTRGFGTIVNLGGGSGSVESLNT